MPLQQSYRPENIHTALGDAFFDPVSAANFPAQILRYRNQRMADRVGLGALTDAEWIDHFGRFTPLPGSLETPLALRYHGHQFRSYNPELGDGRGFLHAQLRDSVDGRLLDLGTKGSGETPWSRRGDGRLTLKGGVREVLAAEMLEAIGVYTSKAFSLIETGEGLMRHDEPSPTRSSVLVRLNHSNIRIGTVQRLAYHQDTRNIERLIDHVIAHYMPEIDAPTTSEKAIGFLREVSRRNAQLAAQWMAAGFVHGVLNSDNINIMGESFDYGPWRFAPTYDPNFIAAYYDETGLYAFGRQPSAMAWTIARLAECLIPLADTASLTKVLEEFGPDLQRAYAGEICRRLGLNSIDAVRDATLASSFTAFLVQSQVPFEQCYFDWHAGLQSAGRAAKSPIAERYQTPLFEPVRLAMQGYEPSSSLSLDHAYFQQREPCTLLIDELEHIWDAIAGHDDWSLFNAKLASIAHMRQAYGCID